MDDILNPNAHMVGLWLQIFFTGTSPMSWIRVFRADALYVSPTRCIFRVPTAMPAYSKEENARWALAVDADHMFCHVYNRGTRESYYSLSKHVSVKGLCTLTPAVRTS